MTADESPKRPARTIGGMNGGWGVMFKIALATYPFVLGWGVYMTQAQSSTDAKVEVLEAKVEGMVTAAMAAESALDKRLGEMNANLMRGLDTLQADVREVRQIVVQQGGGQ